MMKKLVYIFLGALVIFMAGCSKDNSAAQPDPDAWMYDVSLPVPIRFSAGDVSTKAAIEDKADLNGRGFAFVVIDKKSDDFTAELDIDFPGVARNSAKALCKKTGADKYMFTFYQPNSAAYNTPMTYYYPMQTEECYSFYAYHCSKTTKSAWHDHPKVVREKDLIYTDIPVADSCDVLWGVAEATPTTTAQGVEYDGFNATYMRKIGANPSISFKHCTACLNFTLERRDGDAADALVCKRAYLESIDTTARLFVLDRNGTKTGKLERLPDAKSKAMVDTRSYSLADRVPTQLEEIFIMPQSEAIELVLEFEVTDAVTSTTSPMSVKYTIDPTDYSLPDGFEAGKRYRFNMVVYSPEEVSIFADVDSYESGFGVDAGGNDNVQEIDPDASGQ